MNDEALRVQATTKAETERDASKESDVEDSHILDRQKEKEEELLMMP